MACLPATFCFAAFVLVVLARVLSVLGADSTLRELCAAQEHYYEGRCYLFTNGTGMAFHDAKSFCIRRQSKMAAIIDSEHNRWLVVNNHTSFPRWLDGGSFQFRWVKGLYTNYNYGKMTYDREHCLFMDTDGRWADNVCNSNYNVMCERNALVNSITSLRRIVHGLSYSFVDVQSRLTRLEKVVADLSDRLRAGNGSSMT